MSWRPQRRVAGPQPCRRRALAPCRGLAWPFRRPRRPCRGQVPRTHMAVSWPRSRYSSSSAYCLPVTIHYSVLRYKLLASRLFCHNTTLCIATHSLPVTQALNLSQYNGVYCDTLLQPKPLLSQYTWCIGHNPPAILHSQNLLCHNTIFHCIVTQLGSSPTHSCTVFFFIFHTHFFFISFQLLEKLPKYIYIFYFFLILQYT